MNEGLCDEVRDIALTELLVTQRWPQVHAVRPRARDRAATSSTGCDGITLAQSQPPQEILESAVLTQDVQARIDVAPQRQPG